MSPRPKNAPKARLTLWAPRRPRLRSRSFTLGSAVLVGSENAGSVPFPIVDAPGSAGGLVTASPLEPDGGGLTVPGVDDGGLALAAPGDAGAVSRFRLFPRGRPVA